MKKKLLSVVLFLAIAFVACAEEGAKKGESDNLTWHDNIESALEIAKKENKPVMVNFTGSDWCKWCIKLSKEVFSKDDFKKYADDKLVLVKLDYPRNIKQTEETQKYNREQLNKFGVRGFPTILFLDAKGNVVHKSGYMPGGPSAFIDDIKASVK